MKQRWCRSVKIISGLTGLTLAFSNAAFAADAPKVPAKKPGNVIIEHNGKKTIIKFENKTPATPATKASPPPAKTETKTTTPVKTTPAKTENKAPVTPVAKPSPPPVKTENKAQVTAPVKTDSKPTAAPVQTKTETKTITPAAQTPVVTPVKPEAKTVTPAVPKTENQTAVPAAPVKTETKAPVPFTSPDAEEKAANIVIPPKIENTAPETVKPVVVETKKEPVLTPQENLELLNYTFFTNLELSVDLLTMVLNSACAHDQAACSDEELVNILASTILEDLKLKYHDGSKQISENHVAFLLNNASVLKEKMSDMNTIQLNYLISNLNEVNSFFHKDSASRIVQKLNEMQASKPTEYRTDVKPGVAASATEITPAKPSLPGKVVFVSERDGNPEIYTMNTDGANQQRLTNNESFDLMPVWSPDGSKIAFVSERDGNPEIYVMNADGTGQVRLTEDNGYDYSPSWSPDGTQLAFVSNRENTQTGNGTLIKINYRIYTMNADGTEQVMISDTSVSDESPKWSPDGRKIAFVSRRDGNAEIYTMNTDGTEQRRLTNSFSNDLMPNWSPDSKKIAFRSDRDGNPEIYVMNADGSKQFRVTENSTIDESPTWSADGKKIIFVSKRDFVINEDGYNTSELYMMNENGTNIERLTKNESEDGFPDFTDR